MKKKFSYVEYQDKLSNKVLDKKQKYSYSLNQNFINYLIEHKLFKITSINFDNKDISIFFNYVLKEIAYSSLKEKINDNFFQKIQSFKLNGSEIYKNKKIKSIVLLCDKKIDRFENGIQEIVNHTTHELKCDLYIRSLKEQEQKLMLNEILFENDSNLFEKIVDDILNGFDSIDFYNEYKNNLLIDQKELELKWEEYKSKIINYNLINFKKELSESVNVEVINKIKDIFSLVNDNTLFIIYNNSKENILRNKFLFNIEHEIIKNILLNKKILILTVSDNDVFKNTFLELSSYANLESLFSLMYLNDIKENEIILDEQEKNILNQELINNGIKINKYFIEEENLDLKNLDKKEFYQDSKKNLKKDITDNFSLDNTLEVFVNDSEIKNKKSEKILSKFVLEFSKFKNNYSRLKFIDENYIEHKEYSNKISMLDVDGTTKFIQKNWNDLKLLLRNENLDKGTVLKCYILYLHVLKMLSRINKL